MRQDIENLITESVRIKQSLIEEIEVIEKMATILVDCMRGGGKVVFFGNGGSAADAQHLAAELSGRFLMDRPALPALALSTNTSTITAIGNDYGFKEIFSRQLLGIGVRGDIAIAISTSGNSPNVIEAVRLAKQTGMITFAFTGRGGGELAKMVDFSLRIDSDVTPRIQEGHITAGHILCQITEEALFG
jgi:D-sedoheptulose 7-phosphate isomerase